MRFVLNWQNSKSALLSRLTFAVLLSPPFAIAYYSSIIAVDFSFSAALSKPERERLKVYQETYQTLGEDLVQCCVTFPEKNSLICSAFYNYSQKVQRDQEIQLFIDQIPAARREKQVIGYIRAFTALEEERELLKSFWHSESDSFAAISLASSLGNQKSWKSLKEFLEWCTFDLSKEIREFFSAKRAESAAFFGIGGIRRR